MLSRIQRFIVKENEKFSSDHQHKRMRGWDSRVFKFFQTTATDRDISILLFYLLTTSVTWHPRHAPARCARLLEATAFFRCEFLWQEVYLKGGLFSLFRRNSWFHLNKPFRNVRLCTSPMWKISRFLLNLRIRNCHVGISNSLRNREHKHLEENTDLDIF